MQGVCRKAPSSYASSRWPLLVGRRAKKRTTILFGAGKDSSTMKIENFKIQVSEEKIEDLKRRIRATRWPDQVRGADWSYGTELTFLQDLAEYWESSYNWRAVESRLNADFNQYVLKNNADIEALHFIHQKSSRTDAKPLILIHGWPGSFYEFYKIIPMLTNPAPDKPAFHVVAPSLPGFGFSSPASRSGFGLKAIANCFNALMLELGYREYYSQGGDWGAILSKALGILHPDHCKAIHVNTNFSIPRFYNPLHLAQYVNATYLPRLPVTVDKQTLDAYRRVVEYFDTGSGYFSIQSTKPQTLGYAMNDSPVGLLSWLVEKFHAWSDHDGDVATSFSREELITNTAIYWFGQTAASSFRIYYEAIRTGDMMSLLSAYCQVPTGMSLFPVDINALPSWAKSGYNIKSYRRMPHGGHFAALEKPEELAYEIQRFFHTLG